jgi:EmrB/QacA subfamily drug resistance transporter
MTSVGAQRLPRPRAYVLAIILAAYLMIVIDMSIVITALPEIRETFGMTQTSLSWVQNAYLLAYGGFLLAGARAGDIFGRRRMFMVGVAMFTAASLVVGIAPSATLLLAARAGQGVAAAILAPSALSLLQANFQGVERTRAVAYYSMMAGVGSMFGLVFGGALTAWLSWRIGFLVNVPIGVALIVATRPHVAETERHEGQLDLVGVASSTVGMTALVYGLVRVAGPERADSLTAATLALAIAILIIFVISQVRASHPIMPLRLFASHERATAYSARILLVGAITGFLFFTTLYLQRVRQFSSLITGLAFLPMTVSNFCGALSVPYLTRKIGSARLLACATTTTLVGMALLCRVSPVSPFLASVELPMILIGLGGGASLAPMTALGIAGVQPRDAGAASGLVNVAHQLGGSLGLATLLIVSASAGGGAADARIALAGRVRIALQGASVILLLALVVVLALVARVRHPAKDLFTPRD